jgi:hypothetical protein
MSKKEIDDFEFWVPIIGFKKYMMSNFGNVMSRKSRRKLKPFTFRSNRYQVTLSDDNSIQPIKHCYIDDLYFDHFGIKKKFNKPPFSEYNFVD